MLDFFVHCTTACGAYYAFCYVFLTKQDEKDFRVAALYFLMALCCK